MRKTWLLLLLFFCGALFALGQTASKKINVAKSVINWRGSRIIGSSHNGTISFKEGTVEFKGGLIVGGSFLVDMQSINVLDLKNKSKEILEKHLKNEDFFGVDIYPVSALNFTKITPKENGIYWVDATLTIKDISQPVSFVLLAKKGGFTAEVVFDRTLFGIKYNSGKFFKGLGNAAIKDNIDFDVQVEY